MALGLGYRFRMWMSLFDVVVAFEVGCHFWTCATFWTCVTFWIWSFFCVVSCADLSVAFAFGRCTWIWMRLLDLSACIWVLLFDLVVSLGFASDFWISVSLSEALRKQLAQPRKASRRTYRSRCSCGQSHRGKPPLLTVAINSPNFPLPSWALDEYLSLSRR